jgi:hypothetical protein
MRILATASPNTTTHKVVIPNKSCEVGEVMNL